MFTLGTEIRLWKLDFRYLWGADQLNRCVKNGCPRYLHAVADRVPAVPLLQPAKLCWRLLSNGERFSPKKNGWRPVSESESENPIPIREHNPPNDQYRYSTNRAAWLATNEYILFARLRMTIGARTTFEWKLECLRPSSSSFALFVH